MATVKAETSNRHRRTVNRRRLAKNSIGDLNTRVTLYYRDLSAPLFDNKADHSLLHAIDTWAMVSTENRQRLFAGVNEDGRTSHVVQIRYREDITSEWMVKIDEDLYDIRNIEGADHRKEMLLLHCILKGNQDLEANTIDGE